MRLTRHLAERTRIPLFGVDKVSDTPVKKKVGRPKGSKNIRGIKPTEFKALSDMGNSFAESAYKYLTAPVDAEPAPITKMDKLFQHTFKMAMAEDKTSHQYAKLIYERAIPQRKQVEHLGDTDAQRLGVNINVITEKAELAEEENDGITIEHESIGREEPHGPDGNGERKAH
jgi:hypothetical protein